MNDHDLKALSTFVLAEALCRHADDQGRLSNGQSVGYGDMSFPEKDALQSELARRASVPVPQSDSPWTGHARVELMGHRSYLGRVREVERYGAKMGEVQELLASGEYGDVRQFGGKAIHTLTPVTLDEALRELRPTRYRLCATRRCYTNVQLVWGHPDYDTPNPVLHCDDCKAKGKDKERPCNECAHECHHATGGECGCDDEACMKDPAHPNWAPELPW